MKTKKLLRKMRALLSADQRARVAKYHSLEKVLSKLEVKESALREKLDGEENRAKRRELLRKLEVVEIQRKKGLELKREIEQFRGSE